jgi:RimJ/RimL family protein N-acetyltransferase
MTDEQAETRAELPGEMRIETARLRLRSLRHGDLEDLLGIFGDPQVMAAFGEPPFTRAQMQRWLDSHLEHQAEHGYGLFAVFRKADGRLIGDCGLALLRVDGQPAAELGYDFRSDAWNKGYATEAASAVRDYAFHTLGLPRLVSLVRVGNGASRRVAEKVGMRLVEEHERHGRRYWLLALENPQT